MSMLPGFRLGPDAQHDLQRFRVIFAMLAVLPSTSYSAQSPGMYAGAHAEYEPTLGEVEIATRWANSTG